MIRPEDFFGGAHYQAISGDTTINGWWRVMTFNVSAGTFTVTFAGEDLAKRFDSPFLGGPLGYIWNIGSGTIDCRITVAGEVFTLTVGPGQVAHVVVVSQTNGFVSDGGVSPLLIDAAKASSISIGKVIANTDGIVQNGGAPPAGTSTQKVDMPTGTWSSLAASPNIHGDAAGFGMMQGLHLVGTSSGTTAKTRHSRYRGAAWSTRANFPVQTYGGSGGSLRSLGYIFPGEASLALGAMPITTQQFDDIANAYSAKASMPHPSYRGAGASVEAWDRIMLVRGQPLNQASWLYHGPSGTFESVDFYGGNARRSMSAFNLYGRVCVAGGFNDDLGTYFDRTDFFAIETRSWSTGPAMPAQRRHGCGFAWHQVGLYCGGQDNSPAATATVFRLDATAAWSTGTTKTTTNQRNAQQGAEIRV